ncbi:uncharacterized protein L201_000162 [Kwoniella dendrophila CBS 6074]|uniref:Uncharacterized protein n=1 Tax=Kwoniella dendrophila CBS 6074 TaxID=1295534 RepID=A0AAX4JIP2_9TREE
MPISTTFSGSGSGSFGMPVRPNGPINSADMSYRMARMEAFRKVKPTCVALMAIASQTPTQHSQHSRLLDTMLSEISSIPQLSLDSAVINYILFPLTSILRQSNPANMPDNFLESAFRLLQHTTSAWRDCEGGMEVVAWEQLWKFCIAAVGSGLGSETQKGKGKEKEVNQEVQYQAVNLLSALLTPAPINDIGLPHPTPPMLDKVSNAKSPLLPTLFQTITFLLETSSPTPPHHRLQLSSLKLLRPLIQVYLKGKHEVLAAVLPGVISSMAKLVHTGGPSLKGDIGQQILALIENIIVHTLNDNDLRTLGLLRPIVDDLSQLAEDWDSSQEPMPPDHVPPSPASSTSSKPSNPFPALTTSYLSYTSTQLANSVPPMISTLSAHTSDLPRHAVISLCFSLVQSCHESLSVLLPRCLTTILFLSQDTFDPVRYDARRKLRLLLEDERLSLHTTVLDILSNGINSLPRLVTSEQDRKVDEVTKIITAIAQTCSATNNRSGTNSNAISDLLGPNGGVERWSWSLLNCLEFGRPSGWSAAENSAGRIGQLGWQKSNSASIPLLLLNGDVPSKPECIFPHLPLRYIEAQSTARSMGEMLQSLGSAGGESALHTVNYFILFAKANRKSQIAKSVSAIWICRILLEGIASAQLEGVEGKISKTVRKMTREIVKIIVNKDDDEDDPDEDDVDYKEDVNAEALIPVERTKGIDTLTTLLDKKPIPNTRASIETRKLHNQAQRALCTCLSLQTMTLASQILSSSFRPLLLTTLYTLLSHLASPQAIVREFATTALHQIAYNIGYASPQNMVLDNVDYVINIVTLHLLPSRLSPTAPLVLIAMIRLVGSEIVPMVHDLVDEIFDALDDYHGYEALASSLLAVLGTLINVMNDEVESEGISVERKTKLKEFRRVEKPPNPKEDFEQFFGWWNERSNRRKEEISEILERAPQHAWGKKDLSEDKEDEAEGEDAQDDVGDETEIPPSRSQIVCIRILEKSIYYLTHNSPFLRSKIISLISESVLILSRGNRESELLPLIDKSWNSILNKLDDAQNPLLVSETVNLISKLCENLGDFMSKRVLDHVWPRLKILLNNQFQQDKKSALLSKRYSNNVNTGNVGIGIGMDKYSISHRLHISILKIALFIVEEVPVDDSIIWEISTIFRPFLDRRQHEELQSLAKELYKELNTRNGDQTWLILRSSLGELDDDHGVWSYWEDDNLDIRDNVEDLLHSSQAHK